MKILLDIDDTALITKDKGKTWTEHKLLNQLVKEHTVILFSGNPDIAEYSAKWKTSGYLPKGSNSFPSADVLIDNDFELWINEVDVNKCFDSIDEFFVWATKL